jgi:MFS superfamily sulfate permease-like transporter
VLLRRHGGADLHRDVVAGVVVAALLVPQGMAYAQLAGVPPVTGLYATLVPLVVYFVLGPSRILILGPDSAVAPLVAAAIVPLAAAGNTSARIALAGLLGILVGSIMLAGGLARFGFVTELLSMPVRLGYLMGIAVTVIVAQLPKLFGFSVATENLLRGVRDFITGLDETNPTALAIGVTSLALIVGLRRVAPKVPGVFIAVVGATAAVAVLGLADEVPVVGDVPAGLPAFGLPDVSFEDFKTLIPAAVGIAFVAFTDTSVLSRSYAGRLHQEVDQNQELTVLGVANIATGFFQGFPISSSSSRTAVAEDVGAHSQVTGLVGAGILALLLILGTGLVHDLPQATLAAIVIVAVLGLIDIAGARRLRQLATLGVHAGDGGLQRRRRVWRALGRRDRDRALAAELHPPGLAPARRRARPGRQRQGLPRHRALSRCPPHPGARPVPLRRAAVLRQCRLLPRTRPRVGASRRRELDRRGRRADNRHRCDRRRDASRPQR